MSMPAAINGKEIFELLREDLAAIERDFNSLWNTGYFEDIRFEREQTATTRLESAQERDATAAGA